MNCISYHSLILLNCKHILVSYFFVKVVLRKSPCLPWTAAKLFKHSGMTRKVTISFKWKYVSILFFNFFFSFDSLTRWQRVAQLLRQKTHKFRRHGWKLFYLPSRHVHECFGPNRPKPLRVKDVIIHCFNLHLCLYCNHYFNYLFEFWPKFIKTETQINSNSSISLKSLFCC